ncbi:unnamed protein product, partial [Phaeothamnion confervicola]
GVALPEYGAARPEGPRPRDLRELHPRHPRADDQALLDALLPVDRQAGRGKAVPLSIVFSCFLSSCPPPLLLSCSLSRRSVFRQLCRSTHVSAFFLSFVLDLSVASDQPVSARGCGQRNGRRSPAQPPTVLV